MKQILVKKGTVLSSELPEPPLKTGTVKIRVAYSCISAGTELSNISSSGKGILERVIEKPEVIQRAFKKVKRMGLQGYWESVKTELEQALPSGYSLAGEVLEIGEGIDDIKPGDRVAAAGGIVASHAEIAVVPRNLVIPVEHHVTDKDASTVAIGGIALQGIRRADLSFGSNVAVIGTGLLGLITIQLLRAAGMRVIALDLDDDRLSIAKNCGAQKTLRADDDGVVNDVVNWADNQGVDAVIITASTQSEKPLSQAFQMSRKKGSVVLVGVTGMQIDRKDIYAKELDFYISTSYGPGRYDQSYEQKGLDYPYAYVRWTENRNMKAYLRAIGDGSVDLNKLSQKIYTLDEAEDAFSKIKKTDAPLLSFFRYENVEADTAEFEVNISGNKEINSELPLRVALVGVGSFAVNKTLPLLMKHKELYNVEVLVNQTPFKAKNVADRFNIPNIAASVDELLREHEIDAVFITTRHGSHASLALQCLKAGKHVFVEKPLATTMDDLNKINDFFKGDGEIPVLTVGFNRRFSPFIRAIKEEINDRVHPLMINYRMNAGFQPADHWTHEDGGRIIGEACHIFDLFCYLTGSEPVSVHAEPLTSASSGIHSSDNRVITVSYADGSIGSLLYTAIGSNTLEKEYMELHVDQKSITLNDYQEIKGYGYSFPSTIKSGDKGHEAIIKAFGDAVGKSGEWPIDLRSLLKTSETSILAGR